MEKLKQIIDQQTTHHDYVFKFANGEEVNIHHDEGDSVADWEWSKEIDDGEDDYFEGGLWFNREVYQLNGSVLDNYDGVSELPNAVLVALKSLGVDVSECEL